LRDIHDARLLERLVLGVPIVECSRRLTIRERFEPILHDSPPERPRPTLDTQSGFLKEASFTKGLTGER
jgi:hypothetical protein